MKLWQQLVTRLQAIKPRGSTKAPQLGEKLFSIKGSSKKVGFRLLTLGLPFSLLLLFVLFVVRWIYLFLTSVSLQSPHPSDVLNWQALMVLKLLTLLIGVGGVLLIASYFINSWRGEISVWQGGLCIESLLSTVRLPWDEVLDVVERNIGNKNEPTLLILTTKGWLSLPAQSEEAKQLKSHLLNHLKRDRPIPHDRSRGNPPFYLLNTIRFPTIGLLIVMSSVALYIINNNSNPEFVSNFVNLELVSSFGGFFLVFVLASLVLLWDLTAYPLRSYGYQRDVFYLSSLIKEIFRMKRLRKTFSDLLLSPHNHPRTLLAVYKALVLRVLAASASDDVRKIDEKTRRSLHKLLRSETDPEFLCAFLQSYRPLVVPSDAPVMEALVQGKTALGYHAEVAQEAQTCLDVIRELTNPQTLLRAGTLTSEHLLRPVSNPTPAENLLRSVTNPSETLEEDRKEPLTPATRLQTESQEQAAS